MKSAPRLRNIIKTTWTTNLAYAVGLITSDGYLRPDVPRIQFVSKEITLINLYQKALKIHRPIKPHGRGHVKEKNYYSVSFKSKQFYTFLQSIGVHPTKSKTIQSVSIPDKFFPDFLRGLIDGDGTFWTWWDKRWPNSFVFHIEIASASEKFIYWLQSHLHDLYGTRGHIKRGAGVYLLRFSKGDTRLLAQLMYQQRKSLYLPRKYNRIKAALALDQKIKQNSFTPR